MTLSDPKAAWVDEEQHDVPTVIGHEKLRPRWHRVEVDHLHKQSPYAHALSDPSVMMFDFGTGLCRPQLGDLSLKEAVIAAGTGASSAQTIVPRTKAPEAGARGQLAVRGRHRFCRSLRCPTSPHPQQTRPDTPGCRGPEPSGRQFDLRTAGTTNVLEGKRAAWSRGTFGARRAFAVVANICRDTHHVAL